MSTTRTAESDDLDRKASSPLLSENALPGLSDDADSMQAAESVSTSYTQKSWWRRSKYIRYFFYVVSTLVEGFVAGSYLYGYGGAETVFDLGVTNSTILSVAAFNIASAILVAAGICYQAYMMKKNEDLLRQSLEESQKKQQEHISLEDRYYHTILHEYQHILSSMEQQDEGFSDIDDDTLAKLNLCYSNLEKIEQRLAIYNTSPESEEETQQIQNHYQAPITQLRIHLTDLKSQIENTFTKYQVTISKFSAVPETKPKNEETSQMVSSLIYNGILAFLFLTATAASTATLFATPLGWAALVGVIVGTGIYLSALYINKKIEKKIAEVTLLNERIEDKTQAARQDMNGQHRLTAVLTQRYARSPSPQRRPALSLGSNHSSSVQRRTRSDSENKSELKTVASETSSLQSLTTDHDDSDKEPESPITGDEDKSEQSKARRPSVNSREVTVSGYPGSLVNNLPGKRSSSPEVRLNIGQPSPETPTSSVSSSSHRIGQIV